MARVEFLVKSYRWLRELHLAVGAFAAPFVLLYSLSALQMAHPRVAFSGSVKSQWKTTLAVDLANPATVHERLRASHDVRGELIESHSDAGTLHLSVVRPGRRYAIAVALQSGHVSVQEEKANVSGLLNRLHHASGLWRREPTANAWGVAVVLVSIALLVLVATGVSMWIGRPKERRVGLIVSGTSLVFALGLLAAIRLA